MITKGATDDGSPDYVWLRITAHCLSDGRAVIFLPWNRAVHARNQDHRMLHTVQALQ